MKSLNKTETPIFYFKCVLCFQRQPYKFLLIRIYKTSAVYLSDYRVVFLLFVLQDKPNQKIDYWDSGYAFLHIFFSVLFKYN